MQMDKRRTGTKRESDPTETEGIMKSLGRKYIGLPSVVKVLLVPIVGLAMFVAMTYFMQIADLVPLVCSAVWVVWLVRASFPDWWGADGDNGDDRVNNDDR